MEGHLLPLIPSNSHVLLSSLTLQAFHLILSGLVTVGQEQNVF